MHAPRNSWILHTIYRCPIIQFTPVVLNYAVWSSSRGSPVSTLDIHPPNPSSCATLKGTRCSYEHWWHPSKILCTKKSHFSHGHSRVFILRECIMFTETIFENIWTVVECICCALCWCSASELAGTLVNLHRRNFIPNVSAIVTWPSQSTTVAQFHLTCCLSEKHDVLSWFDGKSVKVFHFLMIPCEVEMTSKHNLTDQYKKLKLGI